MFFRIALLALCMISPVLPGGQGYWLEGGDGRRTPLPDSIIAKAVFPKAQTSFGSILTWRSEGQGLEKASFTLERGDTTSTRIVLLRVNPKQWDFRVLGRPGEGRAITDWMAESRCVAGINGGYFFLKGAKEEKWPLGLTVQNGRRLTPFRTNYSGCFYSLHGKTALLYKKQPPADAQQAVQSFPMVLYDGVIPQEVFTEQGGGLHIHRRNRRSAVGEDWQGRIYLLATIRDLSFRELAFLSGALGLRHCLALDGGASTQFALFGSDTVVVPGLERIPVGIGVVRR